MIDVLVTVRFDDSQLARLRAVSPRLSVRREDAGEAELLNLVDRAKGY